MERVTMMNLREEESRRAQEGSVMLTIAGNHSHSRSRFRLQAESGCREA